MAIFDKLKNFADTLVDKPPQGASSAEEADAPTVDEAPSGLMKSAMARAADTVLSASKKTIDLIISRYRPTLEVDAILSPGHIEQFLAQPSEEVQLDGMVLVQLASNTLATLPLAQEKFQALSAESSRQLELSQAAVEAADEEDQAKKKEELEEARAAHEGTFGEGALQRRLLFTLSLIERGEEEAHQLCEQLLEEEPELKHPVLCRFMALREGTSALWCERALWYHPLDSALLEVAEKAQPDELWSQLLALAAARGAKENS